jgi:hypothetical protein
MGVGMGRMEERASEEVRRSVRMLVMGAMVVVVDVGGESQSEAWRS